MARLAGKVAVITGGNSGIGLATAKRFVEEGAYVFITGRRESESAKAKAAIGKNVTTVQGDVAKIEDLDRLYQTVKAERGKVDIVIANAGFVEFGTLTSSSVEHYDKTFGINARGAFFSVQKALPLLRDGGSIILVSSCVRHQRHSSVQRIQCDKSGGAVVRAELGGRTERPQHPGEYAQSAALKLLTPAVGML